jgi:hypothetical protein
MSGMRDSRRVPLMISDHGGSTQGNVESDTLATTCAPLSQARYA